MLTSSLDTTATMRTRDTSEDAITHCGTAGARANPPEAKAAEINARGAKLPDTEYRNTNGCYRRATAI
jgi:hypothetical protein